MKLIEPKKRRKVWEDEGLYYFNSPNDDMDEDTK
jgi:hypothetical protein